MSNSGTVDAGRQVQSPASAGSRGLAKTTQFTKDPTQMKMGNSPIAESMIEIRNILNRIDGINVPVKEDADESRYYEYTGKAFAIRPSGDSDWADKADIPSVINVDSIMVSHYPDMDDYVELTMEHDGPWEIYTDKAVEAALEKTLGMPAGSIKWSEQGQQEKGRAHFDVASTAIGKVAGSSMFKQVRAEESYEPFPEADELSRLKELSGIEEDTRTERRYTSDQIDQLKQWAKKYSQYKNIEGENLIEALYEYVFEMGIRQLAFEKGELQAAEKKIGKAQEDWEDAEIEAAMEMSPISSGLMDDLENIIPGDVELEKKLDTIRTMLQKAGLKEDPYQPFPEEDEMTFEDDDAFFEAFGYLGFPEDETELFDAEYRGRKVPLNKPMRGDIKKFKVYVKDPKSGNVKKVNFGHGGSSARKAGQKTMKIRKSNPKARKSFRARHNCANPGPKTKARYWSCRKW